MHITSYTVDSVWDPVSILSVYPCPHYFSEYQSNFQLQLHFIARCPPLLPEHIQAPYGRTFWESSSTEILSRRLTGAHVPLGVPQLPCPLVRITLRCTFYTDSQSPRGNKLQTLTVIGLLNNAPFTGSSPNLSPYQCTLGSALKKNSLPQTPISKTTSRKTQTMIEITWSHWNTCSHSPVTMNSKSIS